MIQLNAKTNYVPLTYPYHRAGPSKNDNRHTQISPEFNLLPFNFARPSLLNIEQIEWNSIVGVASNPLREKKMAKYKKYNEKIVNSLPSHQLEPGVLFLQSEVGSFVIKSSKDLANEFFVYLIYKELELRVPQIHILQHTDKNFIDVQNHLDRLTSHDILLNDIIKNKFDIPFIFTLQYIPSITLHHISEKRANRIFNPNNPKSRERLIRLGLILAADIFLNNNERLPLIWEDVEYPENLLLEMETNWVNQSDELYELNDLSIEFGQFVAVDNRSHIIKRQYLTDMFKPQSIIQFKEKLDKFLQLLFNDLRQVKSAKINILENQINDQFFDENYIGGSSLQTFPSMQKITQIIKKYTQYDLLPMAQLQIMFGIVVGLYNIGCMGIKRIAKLFDQHIVGNKTIRQDWKHIWEASYNNISLEYMSDIMSVIQKYLIFYQDAADWVRIITLNSYTLNFDYKDQQEGIQEQIDDIMGKHIDIDKSKLIEGNDLSEFIMESDEEFGDDEVLDQTIVGQDLSKIKKFDPKRQEMLDRKTAELFGIDQNLIKNNSSVLLKKKEKAKSKKDLEKEQLEKQQQEELKKQQEEELQQKLKQQQEEELLQKQKTELELKKKQEEEQKKKKKKGWF